MASGTLLSLYLLYSRVVLGMSIMSQHGPLLILAVTLFISGAQSLSMGLLGEIVSRTYYESQNKPIYALREVKSHQKEIGDSAESRRPSGTSEH